MSGDGPATAGPDVPVSQPPVHGGVAPPPAPGQRPAPNIQGPYLNSQAPQPGDPGYQYGGPGKDKQNRTKADYDKDITNWEHDQQGQTGGASGGGYQCTLGELKALHGQVQGMMEAINTDVANAQQVAHANAPAQDADGSVFYTNGLKKWGSDLINEVDNQRKSLKGYADSLQATIESYGTQEDTTKVSFKDYQGDL